MHVSWILRGLTIAVLMTLQGQFASACTIPPSAQMVEKQFKVMIDRADMLFVGTVHHIQRRRWSDDDEKPYFNEDWLEIGRRASLGEDVGNAGYIANWVNFASAVAFLEVDVELYWTGIKTSADEGFQEFVDIDLLRPFTVAGTGPCVNFPRTCPWNMQHGDKVALALRVATFGANKVLFCRKLSDFNSFDVARIRKHNQFVTKYEAIAPYWRTLRRTGAKRGTSESLR